MLEIPFNNNNPIPEVFRSGPVDPAQKWKYDLYKNKTANEVWPASGSSTDNLDEEFQTMIEGWVDDVADFGSNPQNRPSYVHAELMDETTKAIDEALNDNPDISRQELGCIASKSGGISSFDGVHILYDGDGSQIKINDQGHELKK